MLSNFPKRTGIYRIKDNIEHLELKIHFRHINSLLKLPKFDVNKNVTQDPLLGNLTIPEDGEGAVADDDVKTMTVKWQQKLLSAKEKELFRDIANCNTDLQKEYHQWIMDEESLQETNTKRAKSKRRSKKSQKLDKNDNQKQMTPKEQAIKELFTYIDQDKFNPNKDKASKTGQLAKFQTVYDDENVIKMYIYVALSPDTQLCALHWHPVQQLLFIYPDFNNFNDNPYSIEIDTDYRHLYAYGIENISPSQWDPSQCDYQLLDFLHLPELTTPRLHWDRDRAELIAQFAMPPKRTKRISILFEIRQAEQFEYDNIHVRYHIALPANTILEEGHLHASTHSSSMVGSTRPIHQFGHNFQVTLLLEESFNPPDRLHIYFEVISIDDWERERIEGYAHYATLLCKPAYEELSLQCIRPAASSFMEAISRYFIGGRQNFDYVNFYTPDLDASPEGEFHNRYQCRMQSTGCLHIVSQLLSQRNSELLQRTGSNGPGMTLDDILLAYREARERLAAVALQ